MLEIVMGFQPDVFVLIFVASLIINYKFPKMRFYMVNENKKIRIHHAVFGGIIAIAAGLLGHITIFTVGLAVMFEDIASHIAPKINKRFKK